MACDAAGGTDGMEGAARKKWISLVLSCPVYILYITRNYNIVLAEYHLEYSVKDQLILILSWLQNIVSSV